MLELEYPGLKFDFYYIEQLPETTRAWFSGIWPSLILTPIALNTRINPGFGQVKPKQTQTRPARIMKVDTRMMLELENFRPDPAASRLWATFQTVDSGPTDLPRERGVELFSFSKRSLDARVLCRRRR